MARTDGENLFPRLIKILERGSLAFVTTVALALVVFIGILDWATGPAVVFSVFYLVPVSMVAWRLATRTAVFVACLSSVVNLVAESAAGERYENVLVPLWNIWARLASFLIVVALLVHVRSLLEHEKEVSRTDFLTGAPNSRAFREAVEKEVKRAQRQARPLTLVYIDVDRFKEINDRLGHAGGDRVLRSIAAALRQHTRATDTIARLGGDEFGLLLPETDEAGAKALIRSLSKRVSSAVEDVGFPVTFSVGSITVTESLQSAEDMIRIADERMYEAKRAASV